MGIETSFQDKVQVVEAAAITKEADRQQRRVEAAIERKKSWDALVSGAKAKYEDFKKWDQDAGKQIRKTVDMAPGVVGAAVLTGQEKAIEIRNLGYDAANAVAAGAEAVKQGVIEGAKTVGRGMVLGAEIGVAGAVFIGLEAARIVREGIDNTVEAAGKVADWVGKKGGEIRDGVIEMKNDAVDSFWGAVDRVKSDYGKARDAVTLTYIKTSNEITGAVDRTVTKGKEKVVAVHRADVDNKHLAIAGWHSLTEKAAGGVAGFLTNLAESATLAQTAASEKKQKRIDAVTTRTRVVSVMAE